MNRCFHLVVLVTASLSLALSAAQAQPANQARAVLGNRNWIRHIPDQVHGLSRQPYDGRARPRSRDTAAVLAGEDL